MQVGTSIFRDATRDSISSSPTTAGDAVIVRPVQVKGKYPELDKTDKKTYGYIGNLTELHDDMVLAMPFFPTDSTAVAPDLIAFMPRGRIQSQQRGGYRCVPCVFQDGRAAPRRDYQRYFGQDGLTLMEKDDWK